MKKFFLVYLFLLVSFSFTKAQSFDKLKNKSTYLNFLPSNQKANDLKPSDIPSKLVLKQMGFSDEEINEAMDYKYSRGKYAKVNQQISDSLTNIDKFNLFFDDTLSVDSTIYPDADWTKPTNFTSSILDVINSTTFTTATQYKIKSKK